MTKKRKLKKMEKMKAKQDEKLNQKDDEQRIEINEEHDDDVDAILNEMAENEKKQKDEEKESQTKQNLENQQKEFSKMNKAFKKVNEELSKITADNNKLKESLDEAKNDWKRLLADFDNYKKRTLRDKELLIKTANEELLKNFLPIKDDLDRAIKSLDEGHDEKAFADGMHMIYKKMNEWLKNEGIEKIETVGHEFNPQFHEALMQAESDEYDENIIMNEISAGYKYKDKVILHSKVVVSKGSSKE